MALDISYGVNGVYGNDITAGYNNGLQTNFEQEWLNSIQVAFYEANLLEGTYQFRKISSGNGYKFPVIGKAKAFFNKPGNKIPRQNFEHGSIFIALRDPLTAVVTVLDVDKAMADYNFLSGQMEGAGKRIAEIHNACVVANMTLAARGKRNTGDVNVVAGGAADANTAIMISGYSMMDVEAKGVALAGSLFKAAESLDNKKVKQEGRFCILKPSDYYALAQNLDAINKFYGAGGSYSDGTVTMIAGIKLIKMAEFGSSTADDAGVFYENVSYGTAGIDRTIAIVGTDEGVGHVELLSFKVEEEREAKEQLTDYVISKLVGYGVLRNDVFVEIKEDI